METYNRLKDKSRSIEQGFLMSLGVFVVGIIIVNVISPKSVWVNIILFFLGIIYFTYDYFTAEQIDSLCFDDTNKKLIINKKTIRGLNKSIVDYESIFFIYQYEHQSVIVTNPVLTIKEGKIPKVRIIIDSNKEWTTELVQSIIKKMKDLGLEGKISKSELSQTNDFEYVNKKS